MGRRTVTDKKRAQIVAEYIAGEGSVRTLAERHGLAKSSIAVAVNDPEVVQAAQPFLRRLEAKLELLAEKLVDRYAEIADSADFTDKSTTALGIVTDKLLLLKGQATQNIEIRAGLSTETLETLRLIVARRREQGERDEQIRLALVSGFPEVEEHIGQIM